MRTFAQRVRASDPLAPVPTRAAWRQREALSSAALPHHFDRIGLLRETAGGEPRPAAMQLARRKNQGQPPRMKYRRRMRLLQQQREHQEAQERLAFAMSDDTAFAASVGATRHFFPPGTQPTKRAQRGLFVEANTSFKGSVPHVMYDPDVSDDTNERIGILAQTFTHELGVHGKNYAFVADELAEHRAMHEPGKRGAYVAASHGTLNRLANTPQREAYIDEWHRDMRNQIKEARAKATDTAPRLTLDEARERRQWADETRDAMLRKIRKKGYAKRRRAALKRAAR